MCLRIGLRAGTQQTHKHSDLLPDSCSFPAAVGLVVSRATKIKLFG